MNTDKARRIAIRVWDDQEMLTEEMDPMKEEAIAQILACPSEKMRRVVNEDTIEYGCGE